jgi:hypothetical protein
MFTHNCTVNTITASTITEHIEHRTHQCPQHFDDGRDMCSINALTHTSCGCVHALCPQALLAAARHMTALARIVNRPRGNSTKTAVIASIIRPKCLSITTCYSTDCSILGAIVDSAMLTSINCSAYSECRASTKLQHTA